MVSWDFDLSDNACFRAWSAGRWAVESATGTWDTELVGLLKGSITVSMGVSIWVGIVSGLGLKNESLQ